MPAGPIIDGKEVLAAGTYVVRSVEDVLSLPTGAGNIVLVGEFPVLEPKRVYRFTSRAALERSVAPNDATLKLCAKLVYEASKPTTPRPAPASVSLISASPTGQATGLVPSYVNEGDRPIIKSRIWGPRGNTTVLRFAPRPTVGGYKVDVSNLGQTQSIAVPGVPSVMQIGWTDPVVVPEPPNAYGFGSAGAGSGARGAGCDTLPGGDGVYITFQRNLPASVVNVAGPSWVPGGPITGVITFAVNAGATITTATTLQATITGLDEDGVPATEVLTNTPDDVPNGEWDAQVTVVGTTNWSRVDSIDFNTNVAGTFTGTFFVSGFVYKSGLGDLSAADVINTINNLGGGFNAFAGFGNTSQIPVSQLDSVPTRSLPAFIGAMMWSLVRTINAQSTYVTIDPTNKAYTPLKPFWRSSDTYAEGDIVEYNYAWYVSLQSANNNNLPNEESSVWWEPYAGDIIILGGGTQAATTNQDFQDAFDELLYHRAEGLVLCSDSFSVQYEILLPHLKQAWAEFQVPRTAFIGIDGPANFDSLQSLAPAFDEARLQRCFELPTVVLPNGTTKELPSWALAVMMASAANGNRRNTLDRWEPNAVSLRRHAEIASPLYNDDIIRLGWSTFFGFAQTNAKLLLECTGWISDNNALQTQAGSLRSSVDVHLFVKEGLDRAIAAAGSIDGLRGALESVLDSLLDNLVLAGVIVAYREIKIVERETFFDATFKYMPRGTKSYIVINAQAAFSGFLNAA